VSSENGLASRLYRGDADLNIVGRRRLWFVVAGIATIIALLGISLLRFDLGIEFAGGNEFQLPARVGTVVEAQDAVTEAIAALPDAADAQVATSQRVGNAQDGTLMVRTSELSPEDSTAVKTALGERFGLQPAEISDNRVSGAWGAAVTERALLALLVFIGLVTVYLVVRFEWRMAIAAVASLLLDLLLTAGIYAIVGFEVTPSTVIGFLTILGYALYDVVVVFDKIQENTRGITAGSNQTYAEAANLAVNQTLMRSINTSVVALLPVGGLLFIGAGLLGAGTLKDLGLVLFVGMGLAIYSSLFFATPVLVALKDREPRIRAHNQRVLGKRSSMAARAAAPAAGAESAGAAGDAAQAAMAGSAPKVGSRPSAKRPTGTRGGRPPSGGKRPSGTKR